MIYFVYVLLCDNVLKCTRSQTEALNVSGNIKLCLVQHAKSHQWKEKFRSGQLQTAMAAWCQRLLTHLAPLHWSRWHSSRWQSAWSERRGRVGKERGKLHHIYQILRIYVNTNSRFSISNPLKSNTSSQSQPPNTLAGIMFIMSTLFLLFLFDIFCLW